MPAKSQAQRAYLYSKFGSSWVHQHHFDNKGALPSRVRKKKKRSGMNLDAVVRQLRG